MLGRVGGNREDSELDLMLPDQGRHVIHAMDGTTPVFLTDRAVA